jgi:hypothetical protein
LLLGLFFYLQQLLIYSPQLLLPRLTQLWKNYLNQKDSIYRHRLVVWDKEFNFKGLSEPFSFLDVRIEFCVGMAVLGKDLLVSFGASDNAAFVLQMPKKVVNGLITEALSYGN